MKKILLIIITFCSMIAYTQEIVVSEESIERKAKRKKYFELINMAEENANLADSLINVLENMLNTNKEIKAYRNFADLLAQYEYYDKAIIYYDLAFESKFFKEEEFKYSYRKKRFAKDTLLYQRKCAEYFERSATLYTPTELKIIIKLKELYAADQMARNYYSTFPDEKKLTENNLIIYVDTINKREIIELFNKYPEIENPLSLDWQISFIMGRHLFTAYPDFWLDYFEPVARRQLLEEFYDAETYARTYDRSMITSGRAEYSFYGEWDNDGKNVNPDSDGVNRRRVNIGLPRLEDKPKDENKIFITY